MDAMTRPDSRTLNSIFQNSAVTVPYLTLRIIMYYSPFRILYRLSRTGSLTYLCHYFRCYDCKCIFRGNFFFLSSREKYTILKRYMFLAKGVKRFYFLWPFGCILLTFELNVCKSFGSENDILYNMVQ
jgi:hypothetical protein